MRRSRDRPSPPLPDTHIRSDREHFVPHPDRARLPRHRRTTEAVLQTTPTRSGALALGREAEQAGAVLVTVRSCSECGRIIPATDQRCPAHQRAHLAERRTQARLYQSPAWRQLRAAKVEAAGGLCEDCGSKGWEVHHRYSVKDGHPLICPLTHLLLLCRRCHLNRESRGTVPCDAPPQGHTTTGTAPRTTTTPPPELECFVL
jgi:5-methylcytosine-specific restriction endonuclease McrA